MSTLYVRNNFLHIYIYIYITDANERISTQYSSLNVIYSFLITNVRTCRYYDYVYTTVLLQYIYIYIYCTVYATLHLERENQWVMYHIVYVHCLKSNSNFLHITWNQVENMILHTWNSPCSITFSLLHFMLYRFPLGQCREQSTPPPPSSLSSSYIIS